MEPVGHLSEVEEFHLKPKGDLHIRVNEGSWKGRDGKERQKEGERQNKLQSQ